MKTQKSLATSAEQLLQERTEISLPVWIRAPKTGHEFFTGFSRSKLYQLATERHIRSVSIREPGQVKGTRLFLLQSILDYIAKCERQADPDNGQSTMQS